MSAWSDYVDARQQLVHQWRREGLSIEEIVIRLEVDSERIETWLRTEPVPFPGSSRAQLIEWRARAGALEAELHAARAAQSEPPMQSEMRSLKLHHDPECCGCQYWTDRPLHGQHHKQCEHYPR